MADWQFLTEFHFIRPLWLLGILPAVLCLGVINKISRQSGNWEKIINPDLLPYLMQNGTDNNNYAKYFVRAQNTLHNYCYQCRFASGRAIDRG